MKAKKNSSNPEETLRKGSKPSGNGGLQASGEYQAKTDSTTSDGGSNLETLRQGNKPQPEKVRQAPIDKTTRKRAFNLNKRSEDGGAEKERRILMAKHGFHKTIIVHHPDASMTIEHHHKNGGIVSHAVSDLDGLHDSLEDHMRPEKVESEMESKGVDPEKVEEVISPGIHDKMAELLMNHKGSEE